MSVPRDPPESRIIPRSSRLCEPALSSADSRRRRTVFMPMSKGAKIAIGCVVAFVGVTVVISIVIFGGLWWGANKVKQAAKEFAGDQERIERLKREADANPFTPPADKIIAE